MKKRTTEIRNHIDNLEYIPHRSLRPTRDAHALVLAPQLRNTLSTHIIRDVAATDLHLALAHARIDIDIADLDVERAVLGDAEPGVDLPGEVEEDEEGAGEVVLEEGGDDEVGAADGPERDVELGG